MYYTKKQLWYCGIRNDYHSRYVMINCIPFNIYQVNNVLYQGFGVVSVLGGGGSGSGVSDYLN